MSGPLEERDEQQFYASERLKDCQHTILRMVQSLVMQRARVEKARNVDPAAVRDAHFDLQEVCGYLLEVLSDVRPCFMEVEEYKLATVAGQLHTGLAHFDLMSTAYEPVYDALYGFAGSLPVSGITNAAVIRRLMNNIKLGYYPTDPDNIALLPRGIRSPEGVTTNLPDLCRGCGKAPRQLTEGNNYFAYDVELDEGRAGEVQTRLHRIGLGSFFLSWVGHEVFHLLFLNPPYLSVLNGSGGQPRYEKRLLTESIGHLTYGGLLAYVIPYYRLAPDICHTLTDNSEAPSIWRSTDGELRRFKQVAVLGLWKRRETEPPDTLWLGQYAISPASIPSTSDLSEHRYAPPAYPLEVTIPIGERFNQKELERQLKRSNSFQQLMAHSELDNDVKRSSFPFFIGQIGLVGGSGMINGLVRCNFPHAIKGRIVKVIWTETEEKFSAEGKHLGSEIRETIANKMIFNVLTPNGFRSLAQRGGNDVIYGNVRTVLTWPPYRE